MRASQSKETVVKFVSQTNPQGFEYLVIFFINFFLWPPVKKNVRSSVLRKVKNQNLSRSFTYVSELAGRISSDELRELLLSKLATLPE